jgi:hypothetical protein
LVADDGDDGARRRLNLDISAAEAASQACSPALPQACDRPPLAFVRIKRFFFAAPDDYFTLTIRDGRQHKTNLTEPPKHPQRRTWLPPVSRASHQPIRFSTLGLPEYLSTIRSLSSGAYPRRVGIALE